MGAPYTPVAATAAAAITTIADNDPATGITFSTPIEQLGDRTAAAMPDVQALTSNGAVWTKPANAKWVTIVLVGKGGAGGSQGGTSGGGGGGAGEVLIAHLPASLVPATLTVSGLTGSESILSG